MTESSLDRLKKLVAEQPRVLVHPIAFFVARCGVLTLVFDGFSKAILRLKRNIEAQFPGLETEREGSKWPKVTLGVLRDDQTLTARDIVRLRDIADDWNDVLIKKGDALEIDRLAAVQYLCRSLERRQRTVHLPLKGEASVTEASKKHSAYVQSIVSQFSRERMDRYAAELEKDGHRETHYRSSASGWSLVADVAADRLPLANTLMDEVERLVPGKYCRLSPSSRHITIRSLDHASATDDRLDAGATPLSDSIAD